MATLGGGPSLTNAIFRYPRDQAPPTPTMTDLPYRYPRSQGPPTPTMTDLPYRYPRDQAPPTPTVSTASYRVPPPGAPGPTYSHPVYRVPPPGAPGPSYSHPVYRVPPPGAPGPTYSFASNQAPPAQSLVHSIIAQMAAQRAPQPVAPLTSATGYDTTGTGLTPLQEAYFRVWKQRYAPTDSGQNPGLHSAAGIAPQVQPPGGVDPNQPFDKTSANQYNNGQQRWYIPNYSNRPYTNQMGMNDASRQLATGMAGDQVANLVTWRNNLPGWTQRNSSNTSGGDQRPQDAVASVPSFLDTGVDERYAAFKNFLRYGTTEGFGVDPGPGYG